MSDQSLMHWVCSAVGWAGFVYKLRDLRRTPHNPMLRAVCTALFLASACVFLSAPVTVGFVNRLTGVANFAALLVYSVIVALSATAHALLAYWRHPAEHARRTAARWVLVYTGVVLSLVLLFVAGDAPVERRVDFDTYYADTPYIAQFILLYLLALAVAMVGLVWRCLQWARVAGRPWLRRGLRTIVAGSVCAIAFSVAKLLAIVAHWSGRNWDVLSSEVAPGLSALGVVISAVGYMLTGSGQRLTQVRARAMRFRSYRELYPLWDALRRATPAIVPPSPLPWWDLELRLTRRLAEINDGRLALRAHLDPRAGELAQRLGQAAGLSGPELFAVVDAAGVRAALAAKATDQRFPPAAQAGQPLGGTDGMGELAWLVSLSQAFASSPIVTEAIRQLEEIASEDRASQALEGPGQTDEQG